MDKKQKQNRIKNLAYKTLNAMGVPTRGLKIKFEKPGKHIPPKHTGFSPDATKKSKTIYVSSTRRPETQLRTIGHEAKHLTDPKAQKRNVGKKVAEKRAYAFENRFIKKAVSFIK